MERCKFEVNDDGILCVVCGRVVQGVFVATAIAGCRKPACPHQGPPIIREGVTVKVKCGCTQKDQERMLPVHECSQFKRCLPSTSFTPDQVEKWQARDEAAIYSVCQLCPLNPQL